MVSTVGADAGVLASVLFLVPQAENTKINRAGKKMDTLIHLNFTGGFAFSFLLLRKRGY